MSNIEEFKAMLSMPDFFVAYKGSEILWKDIIKSVQKISGGWRRKSTNLFTEEDIENRAASDKLLFLTSSKEENKYLYLGRHQLTSLIVSSYNEEEMMKACSAVFNTNDSDKYNINSKILEYVESNPKINIFKKLSEHLHFCSVIWDGRNHRMIAGVTEPNSEDTRLYYGYTKKNNEIMYSNKKEIIQKFCQKVLEMENNTYMIDGEIYSIDVEKNEKDNKDNSLPSLENSEEKTTQNNPDSSNQKTDETLLQVSNEELKEKIEQCLSSEVFKRKIDSFIQNGLEIEIKRQILENVKSSIQNYNLENKVTKELNELFDKKLAEYASKIEIPKVHIIKLNDTTLGQTKAGFYHEKFEQILSQVQLDEPIMLIGPAGSGKNVAVSQVADALGMNMYYTNNASNEFKLTGFIDAGGNYRDTEFYKAFKEGGIFFLDEIDASDPAALIVINSALANGYMAFPHERIDRHQDFRIIAAANTFGKGADLQYVGRNPLDAATLDRFDNIFFDYDRKLEKALYPNDEVLQFMWAFRDAVFQCRIPHIVSTRGIGKVYKKEINGIPVEHILTSNVIKNLGQDDVNTIIGRMENINSNNKYYDAIQSLRLSR